MGRLLAFMATLIILSLALAVGLIAVAPRPLPSQGQRSVGDGSFALTVHASLPSELVSNSAHSAVSTVAGMSLEQRIRSLLMVSLAGQNPNTLDAFVSTVGAGGFILMGTNIPASPGELAAETAALKGASNLPRLVAIDEEGGEVKRLPYDLFAGANTLRGAAPESTFQAFSDRSTLLRQVGANVNFGVVADVSSDPKAFIYGRSFGSEGSSAGARVSQAVTAEVRGGIASTLKHFPGHGSAAGDSHTSIPTSGLDLAAWRSSDGEPFAAGIKAGASAVMFGHLSFPAVDAAPASLSATWHKVLRDQMNFHGLAITDDMTMLQRSKDPSLLNPVENAIRAFQAGNDLLVYTWGDAPASAGIDVDQLVAGVVSAVQSGRIALKQINESALRVMALRAQLGNSSASASQVCNVACLFGYSKLGLPLSNQ
ncbi:MAG: putative lipoprotein YbbD precursor [Actinomycetota bacterium]